MLEDLFSVVKVRFNGDKTEDDKKKTDIPKGLLFKCPRCRNVTFMEEFNKAGKVCPECNYHSRLSAKERLDITVDKGSFEEFDARMISKNPIDFPDYNKKQLQMREKTGLKDAVLTGKALIRGEECIIIVMDSNFMMASMGSVVGEKITRAIEYATENRLPVVAFTASGGARMQEGIVSLMQMAKTSGAIARHNEAGLLYTVVMTDPTTGGVTASFASLGDIIIAEPKVLIGFAGRRVIEGTIKQKLPDDFQSAEFMLENGFVDMIVERKSMRRVLSNLLKIHRLSGKGAGADE
ncbi:MAG: acetyl-CoA carboxylase carboxyltransferase subunit beta [Ruminococcus sp.]|nr:acetyl-CoA carboxylase carboxyltransferase subunit beta [Ruminococcus sp.]MBQ7071206.1 acetyl-CoA carboxylase carboxyltransferase subunit beta [Ruminococcus sp.]